MDILEAYERTMKAASELEASGIRVEIYPSDRAREDEDLPGHLWKTISFHPKDDAEADAIHAKADKLGQLGITFDTGGMVGLRDWEIDWSFHVGKPDPDWKEARKIVEDVIADYGLGGRVARH